jgi:hypothetical protein
MYVQLVGLQTSDCPMIDPDTRKLFAPIEQHLRYFKGWEAMPERHSSLTEKMVNDLLEFCKDFPQDSKEKAFTDWWCIICLHICYQRYRWAAEKAQKHRADLADHPQKSIHQVLLDDIRLIVVADERVQDELTYPA